MLFTDVGRRSISMPAFGSNSAVATLAYLRERTLPQLIEPPRFMPSARTLAAEADWLARAWRRAARQAIAAAGLAAIVLAVAVSLPAFGTLTRSSQETNVAAVQSSPGVTGSVATRVEELGPSEILANMPFVQRARLINAFTGREPAAFRFLAGASEAGLARYLQEMSARAALPYQNDAIASKQALDAWNAAVAAAVISRPAVAGVVAGPVWESPLAPGTVIHGSVITFYACVGDGFCGNMASGQPVFEGAAACSSDLPYGTRFIIANDPSQRVFVCLDRGALASPWVDVWFYDAADGYAWQSQVGTYSDLIIQ